jgi:hypothetical protein
MKPRAVAQEKLLLVNCVHWRGTISRSALCEANLQGAAFYLK